jgi:hypothetical protein
VKCPCRCCRYNRLFSSQVRTNITDRNYAPLEPSQTALLSSSSFPIHPVEPVNNFAWPYYILTTYEAIMAFLLLSKLNLKIWLRVRSIKTCPGHYVHSTVRIPSPMYLRHMENPLILPCTSQLAKHSITLHLV